MPSIREMTEQTELKILCKEAAFACKSLGRNVFEQPCAIRTAFQVDRDRILHSKAFRRLKHKTQVFISPVGDHYRTRMTHTLEVSQISRTVARALKLNEDLTEAISLGHDLGHTPFGHAGEQALNSLYSGGFKHYEQSVRVLQVLEKDGKGLNLTKETLDGILCHTRGQESFTAEGRIVRICDKIAYINHDIEDASNAGILDVKNLPQSFLKLTEEKFSSRINAMVTALIQNSSGSQISLGEEMGKAFADVHKFMYQNVYSNKQSISEEDKVPFVISSLYSYFKKNSEKLPGQLKVVAEKEGTERAICDYIAGMSDRFATNVFKDIFLPRSSRIF